MNRKWNIISLFFVIGIFSVIICTYFIDRPLSIMEGEEFRALSITENNFNLLSNFVNIGVLHQPINTILLKYIYFDSTLTINNLRIVYIIFAILSIIYLYKILLLFNDTFLVVVITLIYSTNPLILFYGSSIQSYILATFFFILYLYYLLLYLHSLTRKDLFFLIIFQNLAFFSHYLTFFYSATIVLYFVFSKEVKRKHLTFLFISYAPIILYFIFCMTILNQASLFKGNLSDKYFYHDTSILLFFTTESIRIAYSSPIWLIPILIIALSSCFAIKNKTKYSKIIIFLNLMFILDVSLRFFFLFCTDTTYFTVRHSMFLIPVFYINIVFLLNLLKKNMRIVFLLLLFSMSIFTSVNIYNKNLPVDYPALDSDLKELVNNSDLLFFLPEFIQVPIAYHLLNLELKNIIYNTSLINYAYYHKKNIFLNSIGIVNAPDREDEYTFLNKKFAESIYTCRCRYGVNNIWIVLPKERLFGIYHLNYDLIIFYLDKISHENKYIEINPVINTSTYNIFKLNASHNFCHHPL